MTTGAEQLLGGIEDHHTNTVLGRTRQGVLFIDFFDDDEQFSNARNSNLWNSNDTDANHVTSFSSSSSRVEQDGDTTAGSSRLTSVRKFGRNSVFRARLTNTTSTPNAAGSVYARMRLRQNDDLFVSFGQMDDGGGSPNDLAFVEFKDTSESSAQTKAFSGGATSANPLWYKIIYVKDVMTFYTRSGESGPWTRHGQISIVSMDRFNFELMTTTEAAADAYVDVFWEQAQVTTLDYDLLQDIQDQLEISEATAGTFGVLGGGFPVGEHVRSVFWFSPTAKGDGSATSAANAAAGAFNDPATYATTQQDDVFLYLQGAYNFSGAVGGLAVGVARLSLFGLGGNACGITNGNGAATAVITVTSVDSIEISGFRCNESTTTVEGIVLTTGADFCYIHDNFFTAAMENGVTIASSVSNQIINNHFSAITNDGVEISGSSSKNKISGNEFVSVADVAISLNGDSVDQNFVRDNIINGDAGDTTTGISITSGDANSITGNTILQCANVMSDSGSNNGWVNNSFDEITGSFNIVAGDSTNETAKISTQDLPTSGKFAIQLDVQTLDTANDGNNIDFFAFTKIDNTTLRKVGTTRFIEGTDSVMGPIEFHSKGGDSVFQLSSQVSTAVTGDRAVPWKIIQVT